MKEGNEIIGDCKTMCGSSESGPLQSVCGQSVTELRANYLFLSSNKKKKGNGKLFNNLDNDDSPD